LILDRRRKLLSIHEKRDEALNNCRKRPIKRKLATRAASPKRAIQWRVSHGHGKQSRHEKHEESDLAFARDIGDKKVSATA